MKNNFESTKVLSESKLEVFDGSGVIDKCGDCPLYMPMWASEDGLSRCRNLSIEVHYGQSPPSACPGRGEPLRSVQSYRVL